MSWVLAIDFGTTNTTAAFADDGGPPMVLELDNSKYLPSVVVADGEGNLLTGNVADRQAVVHPERAARVPKRALVAGDQAVLGGRAFPAEALAGAVLSRMYAEAVRFHGGTGPAKVILTHPARWGEPVKDRLRAAAALAGMRDVALVAEPEAAAWYYAPPVAGQLVAVFDLGGGTLDTAVLKADGGGFTVAGPPGGDADLGGEDFDELLQEWVSEQARKRDAQLWAELEDGPRAARDLAHLRLDVTAGKEALSELTTYEVPVPGFPEGIHVRQQDLEGLIGEPVGRAVAEMARTITAAGVTPRQLAGLYLTGGSSRIPLVAQRLGEDLGVVPQMRDDPKTVVALGALKTLTAAHPHPDAHVPPAELTPPAALKLPPQESLRLQHGSGVYSVAFSPDGSRLATGSVDGRAWIWDADTGHELTSLRHGNWVWSVAFSPDGTRLATGGQDGRARIWDADTGHELTSLRHSGWVSVAFSPDGSRLATGGMGARIWDAGTGRKVTSLRADDAIMSVAFSPDGSRLATGAAKGRVRIWDSGTGREFTRLRADDTVLSVAFSPDGSRLATGSDAGRARIWDSGTGREFTSLQHGDRVLLGGVQPRRHPLGHWWQ